MLSIELPESMGGMDLTPELLRQSHAKIGAYRAEIARIRALWARKPQLKHGDMRIANLEDKIVAEEKMQLKARSRPELTRSPFVQLGVDLKNENVVGLSAGLAESLGGSGEGVGGGGLLEEGSYAGKAEEFALTVLGFRDPVREE